MKKGKIIAIVLVILVIIGLVLGGAYMMLMKVREAQAVLAAEAAQQEAYGQYTALRDQAQGATLTVTEQGNLIGVYTLDQLGLLNQALADIENGFGDADKMKPEAFAALAPEQKLVWQENAARQTPKVTLSAVQLDTTQVMMDLTKVIRQAPKDAYPKFEKGAYTIQPEAPGTQLDPDVVAKALQQSLIGAEPGQLTFEVADCDPYLTAAVTVENGTFDFQAALQRDSANVAITVKLLDKTQILDVADVVTVDEDGVVQTDRQALEQIVSGWAQSLRGVNVPYIFNSRKEGPVALDFVRVNYDLNQQLLVAMLEPLARQLESTTVEAPFICVRKDQPFELGGTYVEVDIKNQWMTYYVNGEVLVETDVVTGADWGYPTPEGLYAVETMERKCWLSGPDYNVFVEYWVGFWGGYGIHDASWRTIFGGEKFLRDGSHGCVNTPGEKMQIIYENVDKGVPVIVHDLRP